MESDDRTRCSGWAGKQRQELSPKVAAGPWSKAMSAAAVTTSTAETAAAPAEHVARGWGCSHGGLVMAGSGCGRGLVMVVVWSWRWCGCTFQQHRLVARSSHSWCHGAELSGRADQQCPSESKKGSCRQAASGSE